MFLAFYAAVRFLVLPDVIDKVIAKMATIIIIFFVIKAINKVISHLIEEEIKRRKETYSGNQTSKKIKYNKNIGWNSSNSSRCCNYHNFYFNS